MGPWDNVVPYYLQALLPGSTAGHSLELRLQGWPATALYTVKPQTVQVTSCLFGGSWHCVTSVHTCSVCCLSKPGSGQHAHRLRRSWA